jgi:hypothetical protein
MLSYWAIVSREARSLGLTKGEFTIWMNIASHAGKDGFCKCSVATLARETRTHPVYVRWLIRHLLKRKLVLRYMRPGEPNWYRLADKLSWLKDHGLGGPRTYEETAGEAADHVFWGQIWEVIPNAPRALFKRRMAQDRAKFNQVLARVRARVQRGDMMGSDALPELKSALAYFHWCWAHEEEPAARG